jgi:nucleotide-binding universal stress UspA family protein
VLAPVTPFTAVVCVSREATGPGLLTFGAAVAGRAADRSRLYALRLLRPTERASFVLEQQQGESGEVAASSVEKKPDVVLDPLADRARALDVKVRPLSFVSATPGKDICDVASVKHADLIVLGWNKPLLGGAMLTGVVHDVMLTATCDVGVLVDRGLEKIDRVLVPFLGSDHDAAALELARRISEHTGAKITLLHLGTPESPPTDAAAESARKRLGKDVDVEFQKVTHAVPSEAAIAESAKGYDLLLVGVGRQWGLEHKSFGRRAEAILERAATSVVVVRRGAPKSTAEALAETESGSLATVA